jgi:hypothetical protein
MRAAAENGGANPALVYHLANDQNTQQLQAIGYLERGVDDKEGEDF